MSRHRLSDILMKKKKHNPKVAVNIETVKPVTKEVMMERDLTDPCPHSRAAERDPLDSADSPPQLIPAEKQPQVQDLTSNETVVSESIDRSVIREGESVTRRGRKPGVPNAVQDDPLGKSNIIRLLKTSEVQSISSDVIDACKEVLSMIVKDLCKFVNVQGTISDEKLNNYILKFVNDIEKDIPADAYIPPANFEKFVRPLFEDAGCNLKRNTYFFFQQFAEFIIVKLMGKADLVAGLCKRSRVGSSDLLVAATIYLE
jgi:histone H3/H4